MSTDINLFGELLASLSNSITIPTEFHSQCSHIKEMLKDDMSGLVSSLLDFQINAASVNFSIETDNVELEKKLNKFLNDINLAYLGKIPSGIGAISKEYFKERWSASSFPILKIAKWETIEGLELPSKMFIIDGSSVYAKDKDKNTQRSVLQYNYFLGKDMKTRLSENVIFSRPSGRLFDKYPNPKLIKSGVYHNYSIIKSLKNRQGKILNQAIPLLFLINRGSELLNRNNIVDKNEDYTKVIAEYNKLMKDAKANGGLPTRATSFDEKVEHLIPSLMNIFDPKLFTVAEKGILGGMGFLDIAESVSSSRKESVLNPKPFIEETKSGVEGFKEILRGVVNLIKEKNKKNVKYMNSEFRIVSSPITAFINSDFKNHIRLTWERGQLSNRTYCELVGETEFAIEVGRRKQEKEDGTEKIMSPHQAQPEQPKTEENTPIKKEIDKKGKPIPTDKTDDPKKYKNASIIEGKKSDLIGAPYRQLSELPDDVKKLSNKKQRTFQKAWNRAYYFQIGKGKSKKYADAYAFRVAYSAIKPKKKK